MSWHAASAGLACVCGGRLTRPNDDTSRRDLALVGEWWIPGIPERTYSGTLTLRGISYIRLSFNQTLDEVDCAAFDRNPATVHGTTLDRRPVTLVNCYQSWDEMQTAPHYCLAAMGCFVGAHLPSIDRLVLRRVEVRFSSLDEWAYSRGPLPELRRDDERLRVTTTTLGRLGRHLIQLTSATRTFVDTQGFSVQRRAAITISCRRRREQFRAFLRIVHDIRAFLSLAVSKKVVIEDAYCFVAGPRPRRGAYHPRELSVRICGALLESGEARVSSHVHGPLFRREDIPDVHTTLSRWLRRSGELRPTYDMYYFAANQEGLPPENQFFNLVQGLEALHRRVFRSVAPPLPPTTFRRHCREAVALFPADFRERARNALNHSNQRSLRERLSELASRARGLLEGAFPRSLADIARSAATQRNNYAHMLESDGADGGHRHDVQEMIRLIPALTVLLEICLLRELGVRSRDLEAVIRMNKVHRPAYYSDFEPATFDEGA